MLEFVIRLRHIPLEQHNHDDSVFIRLYPTEYPIDGSSSRGPGAPARNFKHLGCGI